MYLHSSLRNLEALSEEPVEDKVMYQVLTSGSGIWENTEDKHWDSSTVPQPRSRSWGGHTGWSPTILSPLSPCSHPAPSSSLLSLPALALFTGQDHNGPGWLIVTMVMKSSSYPRSCLSVAFMSHQSRNPKAPAVTSAASWKLLH